MKVTIAVHNVAQLDPTRIMEEVTYQIARTGAKELARLRREVERAEATLNDTRRLVEACESEHGPGGMGADFTPHTVRELNAKR